MVGMDVERGDICHCDTIRPPTLKNTTVKFIEHVSIEYIVVSYATLLLVLPSFVNIPTSPLKNHVNTPKLCV